MVKWRYSNEHLVSKLKKNFLLRYLALFYNKIPELHQSEALLKLAPRKISGAFFKIFNFGTKKIKTNQDIQEFL